MNEFTVNEKLKDFFARFGIPEKVRSDNGPQIQHLKKISLTTILNISQVVLTVPSTIGV